MASEVKKAVQPTSPGCDRGGDDMLFEIASVKCMSGRSSSREAEEESDEESCGSSLFSYDFDGDDCNSHGVSAVYVAVGSGSKIDAAASMDALQWALGNAPEPVRRRSSSSVVVFLVHVFPKIKFVPSPLGMIPISKVNQGQKEKHKTHERCMRMQFLQKFLDVCSASKVKADAILIESDTEAKAILDLIHFSNVRKLVLGTPKANLRKMKWKKGKSTANEIVKNAPEFCDIKIICEGKEVAMEEKMIESSSERATGLDNQKPVHGTVQSQNDSFRWMCFKP